METSPTGKALIPPVAVPYLTGVIMFALAVSGIKAEFPGLVASMPGWIFTIANGIAGLGVVLGLVSPGLRAKPGDVLAGVAAPSPVPAPVTLPEYIKAEAPKP